MKDSRTENQVLEAGSPHFLIWASIQGGGDEDTEVISGEIGIK